MGHMARRKAAIVPASVLIRFNSHKKARPRRNVPAYRVVRCMSGNRDSI